MKNACLKKQGNRTFFKEIKVVIFLSDKFLTQKTIRPLNWVNFKSFTQFLNLSGWIAIFHAKID
ncbi:hypothetical protein B5J94_01475 [Moraxella lacunata]|uniref:Uncharacterized protein n=1 Tax=Moraxella lacunata TaxID=477 RepID=A0A1V4H2F2_MORLA|nr:hypothetical protein B5J94_01475 [Moraxella lacunata]